MGVEAINNELNRLYIADKEKYKEECDMWKSKGYKIYRDNKGRHKVVEPPKQNDSPYTTDINDAFGGIFGEIFGNMSSK